MTDLLADPRPRLDSAMRDRLGARQHEVLSALLTGAVPSGFEPRTTQITGLVLRRKRWRAAVSTFALLDRQPHARESFDRYARERRLNGCAQTDVAGFLDWACEQGWPPAAQLRRCWHVERGLRHVTLARIGSQRLLVVGIGPWLYELPVGWR